MDSPEHRLFRESLTAARERVRETEGDGYLQAILPSIIALTEQRARMLDSPTWIDAFKACGNRTLKHPIEQVVPLRMDRLGAALWEILQQVWSWESGDGSQNQ